ncbi:LPS assembly lipoprotein LptE [Mesorhizobium sp. NBSH29]|uniref:LPS assembly lipoprotein LptE n=1 Tax=Mesorhizobium sp. NBSH29 TaxID=2654249 RepID=UPI0027E4DA79|nr:LPS assembly lipoprotein LptE [Mesorhizobium sp. NBSH29]
MSLLLRAAVVTCVAFTAACTVRPLYGTYVATTSGGADMGTALQSVSIKPESTRYGQEMRNHLIFLFGGGKGQPASPVYTLDLGVVAQKEAAAIIQVGDEDEPTAGTVTMVSNYRLSKDGAAVGSGRRQISSSYDAPRQEFAKMRAIRDAENRAARELAELVRLAVAQDIERLASR